MPTKIFTLMVVLTTSAFAGEQRLKCNEGKLRKQPTPQRYVEEKIQLCHDDSGVHFTSPDCANQLASCLPAVKEAKREISASLGSPGFKACYRFAGQPTFVEIWYQEKWYRSSLCFFNEGRSFVDTDALLKHERKLKAD